MDTNPNGVFSGNAVGYLRVCFESHEARANRRTSSMMEAA